MRTGIHLGMCGMYYVQQSFITPHDLHKDVHDLVFSQNNNELMSNHTTVNNTH